MGGNGYSRLCAGEDRRWAARSPQPHPGSPPPRVGRETHPLPCEIPPPRGPETPLSAKAPFRERDPGPLPRTPPATRWDPGSGREPRSPGSVRAAIRLGLGLRAGRALGLRTDHAAAGKHARAGREDPGPGSGRRGRGARPRGRERERAGEGRAGGAGPGRRTEPAPSAGPLPTRDLSAASPGSRQQASLAKLAGGETEAGGSGHIGSASSPVRGGRTGAGHRRGSLWVQGQRKGRLSEDTCPG